MRAWKYKRVMPEVIVAKLRLLEPRDILDFLLAGRTLQSICSTLTETPYQEEISEIPAKQLNSISMENAFLRNFIRTCKEIMGHSPKNVRSLLSAVLMKFEANNVKSILRTKRAKISVDEAMRYITPVGRLDEARCRKILESSESVNDVVELMSDMEYGSVLKEALGDYKETRVLLPFEVVLDKYVYGKIWRAAGKLRGLDKKIARTVLGVEIDSINVRVILRYKAMGISEDQIRHHLIPVSEVFSEQELEKAITAIDINSSLESFLAAAKLALARDYQYILTDLLKEYETSHSLSGLEIVLERGLLKTSLRMLKRYTPYFNIGLILAFLNLKWIEVRNLRAIVKGVEAKISPAKIKKLLVLPG